MDEKQFKKHLSDLAHGHHHPEEHDWADNSREAVSVAPAAAARARKPATKARPDSKKRSRKK
jgi:hypothetical protein